MAIEASEKPVKIEAEITNGRPIPTLVSASAMAAMVCIGAIGFNYFQPGRVGSIGAAVAVLAHCPVAIIRGHDGPTPARADWIIVEADNASDNGVVLENAMEEARLRNAPLRVITCWESRAGSIHEAGAVAESNRRVNAHLDRRLARWTRRYPDLQVDSIAVHGNLVEYLAKEAGSVQLVVVGGRDPYHVHQLLGPAGNSALHHADCSVLVLDRQHL
jgi:nucleotide-binding universal stress UspA family protein